MLSHLSQKFGQPHKAEPHEPRAALFLNRFTRTLTIMYATSGIEDILGISSTVLQGKSFYYCISENCLSDAVRCLENAKGNDSIAYLRFWYRDPRRAEPGSSTNTTATDESDEEMTTESSVDQEVGGGVQLGTESSSGGDSSRSNAVASDESMDLDNPSGHQEPQSRTSSGDSAAPGDTHEAIFGTARASDSSASSAPDSPHRQRTRHDSAGPVELEAVISCASDGLVVCLRRARPMIPQVSQYPQRPVYQNGFFAAPWAEEPILPSHISRPQHSPSTTFAPSLGPRAAQHHPGVGGPDTHDFMSAIRDQAIFAWALTGINGSLEKFSNGTPRGESVPAAGVPIWKNDSYYDSSGSIDSREEAVDSVSSPMAAGNPSSPADIKPGVAIGNDHRKIFGDPGIRHTRQSSSGNNAMAPDKKDNNSNKT